MKRRNFIQNTFLASVAPYPFIKNFVGINGENYAELKKHKITKVERLEFDYNWPRHVGKNARKGNHGQYHSDVAFKLFTDQGAMGWAIGRKDVKDKELFRLNGKLVSELISPELGMRKGLNVNLDLALHDLMGVILDKSVYKLIGDNGSKDTPIYLSLIHI